MKHMKKKTWKCIAKISVVLAVVCGLIEIYAFYESKTGKDANKVIEENVYRGNGNGNAVFESIITGDRSPVIQGDGNVVNYMTEETGTGRPKSVAVLRDITLEYLRAEDERINNLYLFDVDSLAGQEKKYYLEDKCCTNLLVSNNSHNEYQITKFSLHAENIVRDLTPYFEALIGYDFSDDSVDIGMILHNDGWGDAHNISLELFDDDDILSEYFDKEDLTWSIDSLSADESFSQKILSDDMLLKYPDSELTVYSKLKVSCDEVEDCVLTGVGCIFITPQGLMAEEIGASGPMAYGIFIDTSKPDYAFEESISENIQANGLIDLPICFFADMSCDMDFYIELEIFDGNEFFTVRTDNKNIHLRVSHYAEYMNCDATKLDVNGRYSLEHTFISYPFINHIRDENKNIN